MRLSLDQPSAFYLRGPLVQAMSPANIWAILHLSGPCAADSVEEARSFTVIRGVFYSVT